MVADAGMDKSGSGTHFSNDISLLTRPVLRVCVGSLDIAVPILSILNGSYFNQINIRPPREIHAGSPLVPLGIFIHEFVGFSVIYNSVKPGQPRPCHLGARRGTLGTGLPHAAKNLGCYPRFRALRRTG